MSYNDLLVKKELKSECSTTDTDSQGKKFGNPRLSNLQMVKQIYGFSYGRWSPTEPSAGAYFPQSPENWYLWNHTGASVNTYYQMAGSTLDQTKTIRQGQAERFPQARAELY